MDKAKRSKPTKLRTFKEIALEQLKNPEFALAYLNGAFLDKEDDFLVLLRDVVEAHSGDIATVAQKTKLSRQNLYRILSRQGNPTLTSIRSILHVVGLELSVQPYTAQSTTALKLRRATTSAKVPKTPAKPVSAGTPLYSKKGG